MTRKLLLAASGLLVLAACDQIGLSQKAEAPAVEAPVAAAPPTLEEAGAILGKMGEALGSNDPVKIAAIYTPDAILLSTSTNDVIKTGAAVLADATEFTKLGATVVPNAAEVQVLDADTIVATSVLTMDFKKNGRPTWQVVRVTQVVQKQADGTWLIANEHLAAAPKPIAARLPPLAGTVTPEQADAPPLGSATPNPTAPPAEKK